MYLLPELLKNKAKIDLLQRWKRPDVGSIPTCPTKWSTRAYFYELKSSTRALELPFYNASIRLNFYRVQKSMFSNYFA
jgi:hypothetical protein